MSNSKQLADYALAPTTHVRYRQVLRKFAEYIHTNSVDIDDSAELGKALVSYINSIYKKWRKFNYSRTYLSLYIILLT